MRNQLESIISASSQMVFFGGAGVSTESGIPDFRSDSGLYHTKQRYGFSPEQIISHGFFERDPETFYDYYKNHMIYPQAKPNLAHLALSRWEKQGRLTAVITQNIDGLHQQAGSKNVLELHGSVHRNDCTVCGTRYSLAYILDESHCENQVPKCQKCGGLVKPDVVLYGESLDETVLDGAIKWISQADTLMVGGTSLVVYPAAGLIGHYRGSKLILINKSATYLDDTADLVINGAIGEVLGELAD